MQGSGGEAHGTELRAAADGLRQRLDQVGRRVVIDLDACTSCGRCVQICPTDVFRMGPSKPEAAYEDDCCVCFLCQDDCPPKAITVNNAMSVRGFRSIYEVLDVDLQVLPADQP
jgi:NAD-dependent dihydropyrimidine dehydrogenase PreA subunit